MSKSDLVSNLLSKVRNSIKLSEDGFNSLFEIENYIIDEMDNEELTELFNTLSADYSYIVHQLNDLKSVIEDID